MTGLWSGGGRQFYRTEPLACGIWCCPVVGSVRIELMIGHPAGVPRIVNPKHTQVWILSRNPKVGVGNPRDWRVDLARFWNATQSVIKLPFLLSKPFVKQHQKGAWIIKVQLDEFSKINTPQYLIPKSGNSMWSHLQMTPHVPVPSLHLSREPIPWLLIVLFELYVNGILEHILFYIWLLFSQPYLCEN